MRIVSFLPSATEIACALGLGDDLVGVTHECDYPPEVRSKPVVVHSAIPLSGRTPEQIDEAVRQCLKDGRSVYSVDEALLNELAPDLILTQDLCQVCAPSGNEVGRVIPFLSKVPNILWMTPHTLGDIFTNIRELGEAADRAAAAEALVRRLKDRVEALSRETRKIIPRPRVFCMEWLSPPYTAGHWMAELVERAGGVDDLAQKGKDSVRIEWERILEYAPEILILSPCGFDLRNVLRQAPLLKRYPGWESLPAVKAGRVYAVDANSYFARPGPRVVEGLELLAHLIHPERFLWRGEGNAYQRVKWEL